MTRRFSARSLLQLPVDLYAAGMIAYFLMRGIHTRIYIWPVEIIGAYLHLLLLPAAPLFVLALLAKSRNSAALLSVGATAYLLLFGELFLPDLGRSESGRQLTLMTYNTGNGQARWEDLQKVIRESGADIVAIQESVAKEVPLYRRDLSDLYPHQVFHGSGLAGVGMLSRYPILQEGLTYLASSRPYLVVDLEIEDDSLTVISAHPLVIMGPGAAEAEGRADYAMMADLAAQGGPMIVAGDLNLTDQNEGYAAITNRGLIDAHRQAGTGLGLTFPRRLHSRSSIPLMRIDYILTTDELRPFAAWVGQDGGSDHLPVLARIAWEAQQ